ncbi:hypothetical protein [Bdellovibrio bacteriovorus]|uniref:hypothetical protein n=1 Tax=Bdellovibrio TaxID=958 RepID=UPI0035A8686A
MKKFIIISFSVVVVAACGQKSGTGSLDLGSLSEDFSYHAQSESLQTGEFSYARVDLKANGDFEQSEALWTTAPNTGTKCSLKGTWTVPVTDVESTTGNELVVNVTEVNGVVLGTPVEKRYDLSELSADSLKLRFSSGGDVVDMTNIDYVTFSEYSSVSAGLTDDTFCNR